MGEYNAKVYHEQGGSVLRVESGGSIAGAGKIAITGNISGACLTATTRVWLGSDIQLMWGTINEAPTDIATRGSLFIRSDGSMSRLYINTGVDGAGSVWSTASELA